MPLVELLNNLRTFKYYYGGAGNFTQKSIPFGNDQPGGLNSGEPYVRFPIPGAGPNPAVPTNYYAGNRASLDFPIRGGSLDYTAGGLIISQAAQYDVQRIGRFLKSNPKGTTFIAKQVGLQLTNPKLEVGEQANLAPGSTSGRFFGTIENTRIYNGGANTLAQVGLAGSGIHADRHGAVPYNPPSTKYDRVVASYNTADGGINNRLVTLLNSKIYEQSATDTTRANLNRLGISRNSNLLFSYTGGPGSVYGIGLTTIPRFYNNNELYKANLPAPLYDQKNQFSLKEGTDENGFPTNILTPFTVVNATSPKEILSGFSNSRGTSTGLKGYIAGTQIYNTPQDNRLLRMYNRLIVKEGVPNSGGPIKDFEADVDWGPDGSLFHYTKTNQVALRSVDTGQETKKQGIAKTFNYVQLYNAPAIKNGPVPSAVEDFRSKVQNTKTLKTNYKLDNIIDKLGVSAPNKSDQINLSELGRDYGDDLNGNKLQDLIKFKFESIEYFKAGSVLEYAPILFRAYLTNFQDNHTAEFSSFRYTGRGENFYNYTGFNRAISFNFKIAVQSEPEMRPLYRKLNYLVSQLYPDYTVIGGAKGQTTGFMRAPFIRLTIGDYIVEQPGFITSLALTIPEDSPWETNPNNQNNLYQLPHILDASCQFTPVHNFLPRRGYKLGTGGSTEYFIPALITPLVDGKQNKFDIGAVSKTS